jgi:signal transduction histidine kinase/CheY-like chemotaxis protein
VITPSIQRWAAVPDFVDTELAQRAGIFRRVVLTTMGFGSVFLTLVAVVQRAVSVRAVIALVVINGLGLSLLALNRRGRSILASKLLIGGLITLVTILGLTAGGVRSPGVTMYFLFVLMAGLLLGQRAGVRVAIVCAALSFGDVVIEKLGYLPEPFAPYEPETFWLLNCLYMGLVLALLRIATDALARGLRRVHDELKERRLAEQDREESDRRRRESEHQLRQSQKMEALGTLAGGIAHDFNNILAAIVGNAELALGEMHADGAGRESIEEIKRAGVRAAGIVKRILLFSRRQEADQKVIMFVPVIEDAMRLLNVIVPKNVHVRTEFAPDLPAVNADASQLSQVVMNLATNAVHAIGSKAGEVSVTVDAVNISYEQAAASPDLREGRYVRMTVRDNGIGMDRATHDRMFEPFFTTKEHEGTGLGLSVVLGIVQEHGGAINVDSEVGHGTTVRVYLPAVASDVTAVVMPAGRRRAGRGESIMYVDDEEMLTTVMTKSLEKLGYRCVGYTDPVVALREFQTNPNGWAAVITDLAMPKMSGLELAREMRIVRPDVRIALVSGNTDDPSQAQRAGISTQLQKPFALETLGVTVEELLARR